MISDTGNRIKSISKEFFDEGYRFVSFDVESLFTNVPPQRSANVILQRIYDDKLIHTDIEKNTMRKLTKILVRRLLLDFTILFTNRLIV